MGLLRALRLTTNRVHVSLNGKRTVVSIPNGPSALAVKEAAWGLARYAAISQILLDGEHGINTTFEVAKKVWAEVFFYLAENNVLFEGILLKPSMVTPGADCKERATPQQVADYTLKLLKQRIPPAVPGIMASFYFLCALVCSFIRVMNMHEILRCAWVSFDFKPN
ncbi:putative fructose-bisphosphate aldolase [Helianthus debilis subsp. tardiflorus]